MSVAHTNAIRLEDDLWDSNTGPCKIIAIEMDAGAAFTLYDGDPRTDGVPILAVTRDFAFKWESCDITVLHGLYSRGKMHGSITVMGR